MHLVTVREGYPTVAYSRRIKPRYRLTENVRIFAIVVADLELGNVRRQVLTAHKGITRASR